MSSVRDSLILRLHEDLVGPHTEFELLENKPSDIYLTGILWPTRSQIPLIEDDGVEPDSEDDDIAPGLSIAGQQRPSVMGVSFATSIENSSSRIRISYNFATYESKKQEDSKGNIRSWQRVPHSGNFDVNTAHNLNEFFPITLNSLPHDLEVGIHVRSVLSGNALLTTVTLMNRTQSIEADSISLEELTLFQSEIHIETSPEHTFVGLPDLRAPLDEDEESTRLLYRESVNYAFGHQCSATWALQESIPTTLHSNWLPTAKVSAFSQAGHEVFKTLIQSGKLSASYLANGDLKDVIGTLESLTLAYKEWINQQISEAKNLPRGFQSIADIHLRKCKEVEERMSKGILFLLQDKNAMEAFRHANMAMHMQHAWKSLDVNNSAELQWRPFQLAFILLTLESICDGKNEYRNTLDLLWFPTGGGKTEAYLALIAIGSWYRRLTSDSNGGSGNFAVMRYTLRLLTAQQFERASAVILASEVIRKGLLENYKSDKSDYAPFSIGLWVGGDATPNSFKDALLNRGNEYLSSPEQIHKCYACHKKLTWSYDPSKETVRPSCTSMTCILGSKFGVWPVLTVDDDIFASVPTVLIGTVDKFAQVPLKLQTATLFGFKSELGTELIIQDELHLISGPLGTIVGIYEVAFDWLLTRKGVRPKILGSTATIRRAASQVKALFDRDSCQFPPAGLTYKDSGFAVVDEQSKGRVYVGITTSGRSGKFSLQAAAGSLLQSGDPSKYATVDEVDGYTTLLMYFNALRELGGAIVQVLDDVPDSMSLYASHRNELAREIDAPKELTSRVSQREIVSILNDLTKPATSDESVDVVLATNMVSVGVDVPRLGLMLVNGQPKTRAEYIQSTSRVGRSSYPGLVVCLYNALKARDRSHFETFTPLHQSLYRDVEATSVTPFASRSRDRALRTILVAMIRHSDPSQRDSPNFSKIDIEKLKVVIGEIERRVTNIDPSVLEQVRNEIDEALFEWSNRDVKKYLDSSLKGMRTSLLQYAEDYARRLAAGNLVGSAWPVMNTMRSVEASTPFRLKEKIFRNFGSKPETEESVEPSHQFPWRR